MRYTLRSVRQAPDADPQPGEPAVWLLADVEMAGVSGRVMGGPHDLAFVAADRSRYPAVVVGGKRLLDPAVLQPGERVSGLVLFKVPPDVPAHGRVVVRTLGPDGDDLALGYWPLTGPPPSYDGPDRFPW